MTRSTPELYHFREIDKDQIKTFYQENRTMLNLALNNLQQWKKERGKDSFTVDTTATMIDDISCSREDNHKRKKRNKKLNSN